MSDTRGESGAFEVVEDADPQGPQDSQELSPAGLESKPSLSDSDSRSGLDWRVEDPLGRNWRPLGGRRFRKRRSLPLAFARVWRWVRWGVVLPPLVYLVLFLTTSIPRIGYPFELEWFEGHQALQTDRVVKGLPLYPNPESGWATFGYPPFYYWVVSVFFRFFGFALVWGRVVSLASTLLAAAGAAMIIYDHTRKRLPAVVGGLLMFAYFRPAGFWFDLFRVDMLAQALMAWGVYFALKRRRAPWHVVLGLILLALAPLTKQTVGPVTAVVYVLVLLRYWRVSRYVLLLGVIVLVNGAALAPSFSARVHGRWSWIYRYLVENPGRHTFFWSRAFPDGFTPKGLIRRGAASPVAVSQDLFQRMRAKPPEAWGKFFSLILVPVALTAMWAIATLLRGRRIRGGLWIVFGGFLIGSSLAGWTMIGGFENNFIPAFCALAICFGLAYGGLLRLMPRRWMRATFDTVVLLLLLIQYFPHWHRMAPPSDNPFLYRPASQQPAKGSAERGHELVTWIANQQDPVYVPHHVYFSRLAGKELDYGIEAVRDLNYSAIPTPRALLDRLRSGHYRYLILDNELQWEWLPGDVMGIVRDKYRRVGPVLPNCPDNHLMPVTGAAMKPRLLFESKP